MKNKLSAKEVVGLAKLRATKGEQTEFDVFGTMYRLVGFSVVKKLVELGYLITVNEHIRDNRTRMLYRWGKINSDG